MPADLFTWSAAERDAELGETWRRAWRAALRFQSLLLARQVPTLAGSDTPCGGILPGQSLWRELSLLVAAGLSPVAALRSATAVAADFLEQPDLGRLQKGCAADLVFVRGDLSQQIPERPDLARVVRDGTEYAPTLLLQRAKTVEASWRDDPWAQQFAQHFAKRANART